MYSAPNDAALPASGFPIRRSAGQRLFSASPRLIAAVHVLLRLLVPRHPPCALDILTVRTARVPKHPGCLSARTRCVRAAITHIGLVQFSRSAEAPSGGLPPCGLSKLSSVAAAECGRRARSTSGLLPRKEVIQPQLPLRLPCYDFTPITSPTFDGSLPCGLGHRLRVLPAFVV